MFNRFVIASAISVNSLREILLRVPADGNTNSLSNALYDCCSLGFDIVFYGI
jgi:hypothetical protein